MCFHLFQSTCPYCVETILELGGMLFTSQRSWMLELNTGNCLDVIWEEKQHFRAQGAVGKWGPHAYGKIKYQWWWHNDIWHSFLFNSKSDNIPTLNISEVFNVRSTNPLIFRDNWCQHLSVSWSFPMTIQIAIYHIFICNFFIYKNGTMLFYKLLLGYSPGTSEANISQSIFDKVPLTSGTLKKIE